MKTERQAVTDTYIHTQNLKAASSDRRMNERKEQDSYLKVSRSVWIERVCVFLTDAWCSTKHSLVPSPPSLYCLSFVLCLTRVKQHFSPERIGAISFTSYLSVFVSSRPKKDFHPKDFYNFCNQTRVFFFFTLYCAFNRRHSHKAASLKFGCKFR